MMRGKKPVLEGAAVILLTCLFLVASMPMAGAGGDVKVSCGQRGWYFAEGYTGGDFDTWILIQNPNESDAMAHLRFVTPKGEPINWDVPLAGETRCTVYLNAVPGLEQQEVATQVTCEGDGVVAERAMYFNYKNDENQLRSGGHDSIGASNPQCTWYMPEGYTGSGFDTYVLLMNPNDEDANVHLKLMKPGEGRYYDFKTTVAAQRRATVSINNLVWRQGEDNVIPASAEIATGDETEPPAEEVSFDNCDVSTEVCSDKPIVAERSMYFDYYGKAGGSNSIASSCTAPEWYLPEGYTGGDFDTWVLAMNPSCNTVDINYTFYSNTPGFEPVTVTHPGVKPYSRDSVHVDEVPGLAASDVSAKVTATRPVELASAESSGTRHMVLFGVDDYNGDGTKDAGLEYAMNDLLDVKHKLADSGSFSYSLYTNEQATVENLREALSSSSYGPDDTVVFMFCGSAVQHPDAGTLDETADNLDEYLKLYNGEVSDDELSGLLDGLGTDRVVALFDCDYGGGFLEGSKGVSMSNCAENETRVQSADIENDAFAYYFAEGLGKAAADSNGNNVISAEEAFNYAKPLAMAKSAGEVPQMLDQFSGNLDLTLESVPANIVAERSVYFKYGVAGDGHTSIGSPQTYPNWFLAEGYTGKGFDTYILVMNPYDYWQKVTAIFMTPSGETIEKTFDEPPFYRLTIKINDVDPALVNTDVSTRIEAAPLETSGVNAYCAGGVVAERAMYFTYTSPESGSKESGGSCSIGYGSW